MINPSENICTTRSKEKLGIGSQLRSARLKQELTIEQVSEELCIRAADLKYIEKEDFEALPTGAYALGFVRTYASFLGVNPRFLIDQLIEAGIFEEVSSNVQRSADIQPIPTKTPSIRYTVLTLGVVFAGLAFLLFMLTSDNTPSVTSDEELEVPSESVSNLLEDGVSVLSAAGDVALNAVKSGVESLKSVETEKSKTVSSVDAASQQLVDIQKLRDAAEKKTLAKNNAGEENGVDLLASLIEESASVVVQKEAQVKAEKKTSVADIKVITLKASADVWLSVFDAKTKESYKTLVLKKGKKLNVTLKDNLQIDVGRPSGLSVIVADKNYGIMGPEWGGVIKRMPFTADYLVNTFYANGVNKKSYSGWVQEQKKAHN
jgi:cytoskeleton protein RodZ